MSTLKVVQALTPTVQYWSLELAERTESRAADTLQLAKTSVE
jgi:hypothetical protein